MSTKIPSYDNTRNIKVLAECIDQVNPGWWQTKPGNDELIFKTGDQVKTTESSQFKPGIVLTVKDAAIESGFARYLAGGVWHKQSDLIKA